MPSEPSPSAWAVEEAKRLSMADWSAIAPTYTDALARILDAAEQRGFDRACREKAKADNIKRGEHREENDRG